MNYNHKTHVLIDDVKEVCNFNKMMYYHLKWDVIGVAKFASKTFADYITFANTAKSFLLKQVDMYS